MCFLMSSLLIWIFIFVSRNRAHSPLALKEQRQWKTNIFSQRNNKGNNPRFKYLYRDKFKWINQSILGFWSDSFFSEALISPHISEYLIKIKQLQYYSAWTCINNFHLSGFKYTNILKLSGKLVEQNVREFFGRERGVAAPNLKLNSLN